MNQVKNQASKHSLESCNDIRIQTGKKNSKIFYSVSHNSFEQSYQTHTSLESREIKKSHANYILTTNLL
jgi:hypothetical protein